MKKILSLLIGALVALFASGCATMEMQTKTKMTRTISLFPVKQSEKTVFLEVKNTAASKIDLENKLRNSIREKKITLTQKPEDANYIMQVNVLFADNLREANALKAAGIAGIPTTAASYGAGHSGRESILVGAAFAVAAGVTANVLEDETYRAVIDVTVREKSDSKQAVDGYLVHETRVLSEAVKTGLDLEEAAPVMENQAVKQISSII